ncbi:NAD-dependent epimerase/dehydratase family protein [Chitinophaga barathri]|nr:NAD-dependent epimerase/dehydratase family protein [Chitinophaga barathri]
MPKILILGSTGFVGGNIYNILHNLYPVFGCSRKPGQTAKSTIHMDLDDVTSWENIFRIRPDVIINASGYGVVKHQADPEKMKLVNYYQPYLLKKYLDEQHSGYFWIQIGTAFEYDLGLGELREDSAAMPLTDYGISKLLFSRYLESSERKNFLVLRPFAMFGPGEDPSKIIPALLLAQKNRKEIELSSGAQQRDYFFVQDLAHFIARLIEYGLDKVAGEVINVGSGRPMPIKELAEQMSQTVPDFNPGLWQWGKIRQRTNEGKVFFNASQKCEELGFMQTPMPEAFKKTIDYYYQH